MVVQTYPLKVMFAVSNELFFESAIPMKQLITEKVLSAAEVHGTPVAQTIKWSISDDKTVNFGTEDEPYLVCLWQLNMVLIEGTVQVIPNEESLKELEEVADGER
ncbi:hypothetical protein SEA_MARYSWELL_35 [Mycobacterium phage MarysWell]|nr:hypothetical protein SEA_MARYSWELL_35 [Mycobacterium phage MarysWell]